MRILIPEAHAMGSVACIRSLGRAGHTVIALADNPSALGFHSRFCSERVLQPAGLQGNAYAAWLHKLLIDRQVDLVLPSEGLVAGLGPAITKFADKLPVGPDVKQLQRFVSKYELFNHFLRSGDVALQRNLPPTILLDKLHPLAFDQLRNLALPLFAKFDASGLGGPAAAVVRFASHTEAATGLPPLLQRYGRGLLQGFAPGYGVGVFFLRWNGQILGSLMHRRLHEVPHTGGVSSFRETWWDEALHADARRRIESMDWSGVGMLEYRWDAASGAFALMEFNARFWGSLHLALFANMDFPRLLVDAWSGKSVDPQRAIEGVRCRLTFPKEVEHLWSIWNDRKIVGITKWRAIARFIQLGLDPRVHSDLWFPGDCGLYWRAALDTPVKLLRRA